MKRFISILAFTLAFAAAASAQSAAQTAPASLDARAKAALALIHGTLKVRGLQQTVRVQRDHWGVAHIYAQNEHDLFFAQGFVVAQDRLFQMELWKRSGQGRLAEILGSSFVKRDVSASTPISKKSKSLATSVSQLSSSLPVSSPNRGSRKIA
jgi:acyl-homoserine lactone acylase PvdQ